jgi:hypothetical protein
MRRFYALLAGFLLGGCQAVDRGSFGPFERSLNNKTYGYEVVDDPTGSAPTLMVERFEVRPVDCSANSVWSDCKTDRERSELIQKGILESKSSNYWYG